MMKPGLLSLIQANIKWGAECQSYEMSITSETAHLPGTLPTIKAKIHWSRMPEKVTQACSRWASEESRWSVYQEISNVRRKRRSGRRMTLIHSLCFTCSHNVWRVLLKKIIFFVNYYYFWSLISQTWKLHSRYGSASQLLPKTREKCRAGDFRISNRQLSRQHWCEDSITRGIKR